jgi:hypothetical protein
MANEGVLVNGDYTVHARGVANFVSFGDGVQINAMGSEGTLVATGEKAASLMSGPASVSVVNGGATSGEVDIVGGLTGTIKQVVGAPVAPSSIVLEPARIAMSVGPPGVGASAELSLEGISLKYALWSLEIKATGITLGVGPSSLSITPGGVNASGLTVGIKGELSTAIEGVMTQLKAGGIMQVQGALTQIG